MVERENEKLTEKVARLEKENKALLADLWEADLIGCKHCRNHGKEICRDCYHGSCWWWRGVVER